LETDEATIVVLNTANLNIGACNNFATLVPIAKDARARVHVDGAFGLFARASAGHGKDRNGPNLASTRTEQPVPSWAFPTNCIIVTKNLAKTQGGPLNHRPRKKFCQNWRTECFFCSFCAVRATGMMAVDDVALSLLHMDR